MEGDRWPVSPGRGSPNFPVTIFRGSYGSAILKRKERASAGEDACPPGSRGWTIAQRPARPGGEGQPAAGTMAQKVTGRSSPRSEEHTSELQSLRHLVCR